MYRTMAYVKLQDTAKEGERVFWKRHLSTGISFYSTPKVVGSVPTVDCVIDLRYHPILQ